MKLTPEQIASAKAKATRAFKAEEQKLALWAVCLIGWREPGPARFGDNRGSLPVRLAITSKKPEHASRDDDRFSPLMPVATLEYVYVETEEHAKRLKDALDAILFGQQDAAGSSTCRGSYFNARDFFDDETTRGLWWAEVLREAQRRVMQKATRFQLLSESDKQARITRGVAGGIR